MEHLGNCKECGRAKKGKARYLDVLYFMVNDVDKEHTTKHLKENLGMQRQQIRVHLEQFLVNMNFVKRRRIGKGQKGTVGYSINKSNLNKIIKKLKDRGYKV